MLKFLATTENTRTSDQKSRVIIAGKVLKKYERKMPFATLPELHDASRAILFPIPKGKRRKRERTTIDWTRVNLEWKSEQLKLPNGPDKKTYSGVQTDLFKTF